MPSPIAQLLSRTEYAGDGVTTSWGFSFSGGYLDRDHVKAYTKTSTGIRTPLTIMPGDFTGDYTLNLGIVPVDTNLVIYRDTPKDLPLVNFVDGGRITETSLDLVAKQAVFIAAETTDIVNTSDAIAAGAAAASAAASAAAALAAIAPVPAAVAAAVAAANAAVNAAAAITLPLPLSSGGTGVAAITTADAQTGLNVPSRTGGGASGNWGINITGNAATATTAVSASSATNAVNATNATTPALSDVSTKIATTAFVDGLVSSLYATAYLPTSYAIPTATFTTIPYVDDSDPFTVFNASLFSPNVAGWYYITAGVQIDVASPGFLSIFKGTNEHRRGWWGDTGTPAKDFQVSAMVYLNGTSDYVAIKMYQHSGATRNAEGLATVSWMDAFFVRKP